MIRRSHRGFDKSSARSIRVRDKAAQLRNRVKQSTQMFMARHQSRMTWWKTAFRAPVIAFNWIFEQAKTWVSALMALLGLQRQPSNTLLSRKTDIRRTKRNLSRSLRHEMLEGRQLMAFDVTSIALDPTSDTSNALVAGSATDGITRDTTPTFNVSFSDASVGDKLELKVGGNIVATHIFSSASASGSIPMTSSTLSGDGLKNVTVDITPNGGPTSEDPQGSTSFTLDTTPVPLTSISVSGAGVDGIVNKSELDVGIGISVVGGESDSYTYILSMNGGLVSQGPTLISGVNPSITLETATKDAIDLLPDGPITFDLTFRDRANNLQIAASNTVVKDTSLPTVSISSSIGNGTATLSTTSITYTFTFNEDVTGFTSSDVTVTNGTKGTFTAVSAKVYTLVVTPSDVQGDLTVAVGAAAANDAAGNPSIAATTFTQPVDRIAPTPTITSSIGTGTANIATGDVTYTITFDQDVTGFTSSDATVTNGTKGTFTAVSAKVYTLVVTPSDVQGDLTVAVAAAAANDAAGNPSIAATTFTQPVDRIAPTPTITSSIGTGTANIATGDVTYTITFDQDVTGFTSSDVTVTNGTKGTFTAVSAKVYTLVVTPSDVQGDLTVAVGAAAANDAAGNPSIAATTFTQPVDRIAPTPTITSSIGTGTANIATGNVTYTITFDQDVTGFTSSDVTVTNGTKGTFAAVSAKVYTLVVTPAAATQGSIVVSIPASAAADLGGNPSVGPVSFSQPLDTIPPATPTINPVDIDDLLSGNDSISSISGTADNGSVVVDVIRNGTVTHTATVLASGGTWSIPLASFSPSLSPLADGDYDVFVQSTDNSGNPSTVAQYDFTVDFNAPTVTITSSLGSGTATLSTTSITYTFTFSENVSGFTSADVTVTNGTKGAFTTVNPKQYTLVVTPGNVENNLTVAVAAGVAFDSAGNPNVAATTFSQPVDRIAPTPTITSSIGTGTANIATGNVTYTITFDQNVTGFTSADVTVTNGTKGTFTEVTPKQYTLVVTPNNIQGSLTVAVAAAAANDAAGNPSLAATTFTQTVDRIAPTPTITSSIGSATANIATGNVTYTITFDQDVTDFTSADVTVTNGTKGTFTPVSAKVYTLEVTPNAGLQGNMTISLPAGAAVDGGLNPSLAATTFTQPVDVVAPSITSRVYPAINQFYLNGVLQFAVEYDDAVIVSGVPRISMVLDQGGLGAVTRFATYTHSSLDNKTAFFSYTVQSGDFDPDGVQIANAISFGPSPGSIQDASGNNAALTLTGQPTDIKIDGKFGTVLTGGGDVIVKLDGANVQVISGTTILLNTPYANFGTSTLQLLDDASSPNPTTVTIDGDNGNPIPVAGLRFTGGSGDKLVHKDLAGLTAQEYWTSTPVEVSAPVETVIRLNIGGPLFTIIATGLAEIESLDASDITFYTPAAGGTVSVSDLNAADDGKLLYSDGVGNLPQIKFNSTSGSISIIGGEGDDEIVVDSLDADSNVSFFVVGGDGEDSLTIDLDGMDAEFATFGPSGVVSIDSTSTVYEEIESLEYSGDATSIFFTATSEGDDLAITAGSLVISSTATVPTIVPTTLSGTFTNLSIDGSGGNDSLSIDADLNVTGDLTIDFDNVSQETETSVSVGGIFSLTNSDVEGAAILTNATNDFDEVKVDFFGDVSLRDADEVELSMAVADDLSVQAGGLVEFTSNVTVFDLVVNTTGAVEFDSTVVADDIATLSGGAATFSGAVQAGSLSVTSGGNVSVSGVASIAGATSVTATGSDISLANPGNEFNGSVAVAGKVVTVVDSDVVLSLATSVVSQSLSLSSGALITQTGPISGAGSVEITSGAAAWSQANIYTGGTTIPAGSGLTLSAANVLPDTGKITISGGSLNVQSFNDAVGQIELVSGTITGTTGKLTPSMTTLAQAGTINAIIAGSSGLTKSTSGTVTVSKAQEFTGGVSVMDGTLSLTTNNALPSTTVASVQSPGVLNLNGNTLTLSGLNGNGTVNLANGSLAVGNGTTAPDSFAGVISGGGTLTKSGTNPFSYSGSGITANVVVSGGKLTSTTAPITGSLNINSGAEFSGGGSVSGAVTMGGTLSLTNNMSVGSLTSGSAGSLAVTLAETPALTPKLTSQGNINLSASGDSSVVTIGTGSYGTPIILMESTSGTVSGTLGGSLAPNTLVSGGSSGPYYWPQYLTSSVRLVQNVGPIVTPSIGNTNYNENSGFVVVDPGIVPVDFDSALSNSANWKFEARLASNPDGTAESLFYNDVNNTATANFKVATGATNTSLTVERALTTSIGLPILQTALRFIGYRNTSLNPSTANRIVEFRVFDGAQWSTWSSKTIQIVPVDNPPVANAGGTAGVYTIAEGGTLNLNGSLSSDVDSPSITSWNWKVNEVVIPPQSSPLLSLDWATLNSFGITDDVSNVSVTLTVSNALTSTVSNATLNVTNVNSTITIAPASIVEGNGVTINATVTDPVASDIVGPYFWEINPTPGSTSTSPGFAFVAATASPTLTRTWSQLQSLGITTPGTYSVKMSFTGAGGDGLQVGFSTLTVTSADVTPPTLSFQNVPTSLGLNEEATITIQFSEAVVGFNVSDLSVSNGNGTIVAGSFTAVDADTYTVKVAGASNIASGTFQLQVGTGYTDAVGNSPVSTQSTSAIAVDTVAPTVDTITVGTFGASRSRVLGMTLVFNEAISVSNLTEAFTVRRRGTNAPVVINTSASSVSGNTVTLVFAAGGSGAQTDATGSLIDGNFELVVDPTKLGDSVGNDLTGGTAGVFAGGDGGSFVFGDKAADRLFRLFGDTDGDLVGVNYDVDGANVFAFNSARGTLSSSTSYRADLDSDGDGDIDGADVFRFNQNRGKVVSFS